MLETYEKLKKINQILLKLQLNTSWCIIRALQIEGRLQAKNLETVLNTRGQLNREETIISPATLNRRLKELETHGIVRAEGVGRHGKYVYYSMTEKGEELARILEEAEENLIALNILR